MKVLCIQSYPQDPPGEYLERSAAAFGATIDSRQPIEGDALPENDEGFDGLIIMGGAMHAADDAGYPHLELTVDLVRGFHEREKPVLGICLGGQLVARAFGGRTFPAETPEIGFHRLYRTPQAKDDAIFRGLPDGGCELLEFHFDSFDLPPNAIPLMTGKPCHNQIFRMGRTTYAFQPHFEASPKMLHDWLTKGVGPAFRDEQPELHARALRQIEYCEGKNRPFCLAVGDAWFGLVEQRRRDS